MTHVYSSGVWMLILATVVPCLMPVTAIIDCYSRVERGNAYEECFNDQGLEAPDIFESYRTSDSADIDEIPVEDMMFQYGESFCGNNSAGLKEAVRCSYQIDTDCSNVLTRALLPSPDDMARTMGPVCDNVENIDFMCIKGRQPMAADCGAKRAAQLGSVSDAQTLICLTRLITAECLKKEYKTCGCVASKVYSDVTMDILMPESCDQTTSPVVCSATEPNEFVDDGLSGASRQGLTFGLLAVSVLVVAIVSM